MSIILDIKNIEVSIDEHPILQHITLPITEHAITAVIGPSGCGKSTLLATLNGSLQVPKKVTNGQIIYDGLSVDSIDSQMLRRQIGLIGQQPTVFPGTIEDNMVFALNYYKELSSADRKAKAIQCLEQAGLYSEINGDMKRLASSLSGGQQGKLLLLDLVLRKPNFLLLDEPTRNFSPTSQPEIRKLFATYPGGLITVSHDRRFLKEVCSIIYRLTEHGLEVVNFQDL